MTRFPKTILLGLLSSIALFLPAQGKKTTERSVHVPFVGCKADGQAGPEEAPSGEPVATALPADIADKLAYYRWEGLGVLAPKGWNCFAVYGSNGESLFVSPDPINGDRLLSGTDLFSDTGGGFRGPAIQLSVSLGDTSGRVEVAQIIARVFPQRRSFIHHLTRAHDGILNESDVVYGPYKTDNLVRPDRNTVEFQTPANADGLGTMSALRKNAWPITGVIVLTGETPDATHLSIRLNPDQASLAPYIIQRLEMEIRSAK